MRFDDARAIATQRLNKNLQPLSGPRDRQSEKDRTNEVASGFYLIVFDDDGGHGLQTLTAPFVDVPDPGERYHGSIGVYIFSDEGDCLVPPGFYIPLPQVITFYHVTQAEAMKAFRERFIKGMNEAMGKL